MAYQLLKGSCPLLINNGLLISSFRISYLKMRINGNSNSTHLPGLRGSLSVDLHLMKWLCSKVSIVKIKPWEIPFECKDGNPCLSISPTGPVFPLASGQIRVSVDEYQIKWGGLYLGAMKYFKKFIFKTTVTLSAVRFLTYRHWSYRHY